MTREEIYADVMVGGGMWARRYEVSNMGNVRSKTTGRVMKPQQPNRHYKFKQVVLSKGSRNNLVRSGRLVHRLVAEHFCDGYTDGCDVHHIDGDVENNCADNLVCVTRGQHVEIHLAARKLRIKQATEMVLNNED